MLLLAHPLLHEISNMGSGNMKAGKYWRDNCCFSCCWRKEVKVLEKASVIHYYCWISLPSLPFHHIRTIVIIFDKNITPFVGHRPSSNHLWFGSYNQEVLFSCNKADYSWCFQSSSNMMGGVYGEVLISLNDPCTQYISSNLTAVFNTQMIRRGAKKCW